MRAAVARHGVHSIHRSPNVRCRKLFGICWRRSAWQAWCDCGWQKVYRRRWEAEYRLYGGHIRTHEIDLGDYQ
jgi:hypothetical protein